MTIRFENLRYTCAGVPTRPRVSVVATERSVVIEWTPSLGLLAVTDYSVLVNQESEDGVMALVDALNIRGGVGNNTVIEGLKPFSRYAVKVVAINIAGNRTSSELVNFSTLEAGKSTNMHTFCRVT